MNADVWKMFNVSPATANRILSELVSKGKIAKCRYNGHWAYELKKQTSTIQKHGFWSDLKRLYNKSWGNQVDPTKK